MNTVTTYNIPIELNTTGGYTIKELKEKLMAYALTLVSTPKKDDDKPRKILVSDRIKSLSAVPPSNSQADYKDEIIDILSDKY